MADFVLKCAARRLPRLRLCSELAARWKRRMAPRIYPFVRFRVLSGSARGSCDRFAEHQSVHRLQCCGRFAPVTRFFDDRVGRGGVVLAVHRFPVQVGRTDRDRLQLEQHVFLERGSRYPAHQSDRTNHLWPTVAVSRSAEEAAGVVNQSLGQVQSIKNHSSRLLVPQCRKWINFRRASRRDVTRNCGDEH